MNDLLRYYWYWPSNRAWLPNCAFKLGWVGFKDLIKNYRSTEFIYVWLRILKVIHYNLSLNFLLNYKLFYSVYLKIWLDAKLNRHTLTFIIERVKPKSSDVVGKIICPILRKWIVVILLQSIRYRDIKTTVDIYFLRESSLKYVFCHLYCTFGKKTNLERSESESEFGLQTFCSKIICP